MCETCYDGFQYGEDKYDIGGTGTDCYVDIYFVNADWLGDQDNHDPPITCNEYKFSSDVRGLHGPSDLLVWNVSAGQFNTGQNLIKFEWDIDSLPIAGNAFSEYDIYMHNLQDNTKINMKEASFSYISTSDLGYISDGAGGYTTNMKIYMGGCAAEGLTTFYPDTDGDGLGANSGEFAMHCLGFEPDGWADNNYDNDDSIFCESNDIDSCGECDGDDISVDCAGECFGSAIIDSCGVCSGGGSGHTYDSDIDCNGDCFGAAFIDDCGICSDGGSGHDPNSDMDCNGACYGDGIIDSCGECDGQNLSCLDQIFGDGPSNLYALIEDESVRISWDYTDIDSYQEIEMFRVIHDSNGATEIIGYIDRDDPYEIYSFNHLSGTFCVAGVDTFGNAESYTCTEATIEETLTWTLHNSANMISFPVIPSDPSISSVLSQLTTLGDGNPYTLSIITGGLASIYNWNQGLWVGNISTIDPYSGYYLSIDLEQVYSDPDATVDFSVTGVPVECDDIEYTLTQTTFVSFQSDGESIDIDDAFPIDTLGIVTQVIGEGIAAAYISGIGWVGALEELDRGKGYWIRTSLDPDDEINFQWNCSD